jgi:TonB family protein
MLLSATVGLIISVALPAARQRPSADVAAPCPTGSTNAIQPAIGIGPTIRPRVRKHMIGSPPMAFLDARVDGRVIVSATVDTDGTPCDIQVVSSSPSGLGLEATGIESIAEWRFTAATRDGSPVRAPVTIELTFAAYKKSKEPGARHRTVNAKITGADLLLTRASGPK